MFTNIVSILLELDLILGLLIYFHELLILCLFFVY
jgi:hypothetical protein